MAQKRERDSTVMDMRIIMTNVLILAARYVVRPKKKIVQTTIRVTCILKVIFRISARRTIVPSLDC